MLHCEINKQQLITCQQLSFECTASYLDSDAEKSDILVFDGQGTYLDVNEKKLDFNGEADYIEADVKLISSQSETIPFVKGQQVPFTLSFVKKGSTYIIHTELSVEDENKQILRKSMDSKYAIDINTWYKIKIIISDCDYHVLINNTVYVRRFFDELTSLAKPDSLRFGGAVENSGFYLTNLAFSRDIFEEGDKFLEDILSKADEQNLFGQENARMDQEDNGNSIGSPKTDINNNGIICHEYERGAIIESPEKEFTYLSDHTYYYYKKNLKASGFPATEISYISKDGTSVTQVIFPETCLFSLNSGSKYLVINGETMKRYLSEDPSLHDYWYPIEKDTISVNNETELIYVVLSSDDVIYEANGYAIFLSLELHNYYKANVSQKGIGLPVSDYVVYYDKEGYPYYQTLPCQNGTIHDPSTWDGPFFTDKRIGSLKSKKEMTARVSEAKKNEPDEIKYYDFTEGVVVLYPNGEEPVVHSSLKFQFDGISTGDIDDGINDDAELYLKLTTYVDGKKIHDHVDLGSHSYLHGSKNYKFSGDSECTSERIYPLSGSSYFHFIIDLYDYDPESKNDYIGTFDYLYSISNGWGLDQYNQTVNQHYGSHEVPMTSEGKDNNHGLNNNIISFSVAEYYDFELMKKNPRKYLGFPFRNFKGSYVFTEDDFSRIFSNVSFDWWNLGWMYDLIFFEACKGSLDGAKCHGFAVAELAAIHGQGPFQAPLLNYGLKKGSQKSLRDDLYYEDMDEKVGKNIVNYYLYQKGWDFIMWQWKKMNANEYIFPHDALPSIISRIDKEQFCLINCKPANLNGHAVLAYGHNHKSGYDAKIYIIDCNHPYYEGENFDNPSYISIKKVSGGHDKVEIYYKDDVVLNYRYLFETPFSVACKPPRVPNTFDIIVGSLESMIAGWIEGAGNLFEASDDSGIVYDEEGTHNDYTKFLPICSDSGPDGKQVKMFLFKKDSLKIKLKGTSEGSIKYSFACAKTFFELDTQIGPDEQILLSSRRASKMHRLELSLIRDGKQHEAEVSVSRGWKTGKISHQFRHKLLLGKEEIKLEGLSFGSRMRKRGPAMKDLAATELLISPRRRLKMPLWTDYRYITSRKEPMALIGNQNVSVEEFANIYNCSQSTVRKYCRENVLKGAYKEKRKWVVPANQAIPLPFERKKMK